MKKNLLSLFFSVSFFTLSLFLIMGCGSKFVSMAKKTGEYTTGINMSNEPFCVLPPELKKALDISIESCYGEAGSNSVTLVFLAKSKNFNSEFRVGNSMHGLDLAFDKKGNTFKRYGGEIIQNCPVNVPVRYEVSFDNIPNSIENLELIQLTWWVAAGEIRGNGTSSTNPLVFRNIPIQWR